MNVITFKVQNKNGRCARAAAIPANRSAQTYFGLVDAAIITLFLLGAGGLTYLLILK